MTRCIKPLAVLLVTATVFAGCPASQTSTVLRYGKLLLEAVLAFETARTALSRLVDRSVEPAVEELGRKKIDLHGVSEDWEEHWNEVKEAIPKLDKAYHQVGVRSAEYFQQLDEISSGITDAELKKREEEKNAALRSAWNEAYESAGKEMEKIKALGVRGEDFHRVLLLAALRKEIQQQIQELNSIAETARAILSELEKLTIEGKSLAESSQLQKVQS